MKNIIEAIKKKIVLLSNKLFSGRLILILGCQRSGTTLIYMILTAHPRISGRNEDESLFEYPHWRHLIRHWLENKYCCFKLPTKSDDLEFIRKNYPRAKIIWPLRHPHAVISSMRSLTIHPEGKNWLSTEKCGPTEIKRLQKLFPEIGSIHIEGLDELELGAHIWKYKKMAIEQYQNSRQHIQVIVFEELLKNPENYLKDVFRNLNIKWSDSVLHHERLHTQREYIGRTDGEKPLDKSRENPDLNLTDEEMKRIDKICSAELKEYY